MSKILSNAAEKIRESKTIGREVFMASLGSNIMTNFSGSIGTMVDGVVIGNFLGGNAIAAYAVVSPVTLIYNLVGGILAGGSRTLYSHLLGKGKKDEANGIFSLAMVSCFILSFLMTVLTILFADGLAVLLGAGGKVSELMEPVRDYMIGVSLGTPFYNASRIISGYMQIDSDNKRPVWGSTVMTIVDIVGDLLVVFVFHGGMLGMGIATSVGNLSVFLVMIQHFTRKDRILQFSLKNIPWNRFGDILHKGAPAGVTRIASFIKGRSINGILAAFSATAAIAAFGVQKQMNNLFFALYVGIAEVVWLLASIYYGEEDSKSLKELQRLTLRAGLILGVAAGVVIFVFAKQFALMYAAKSSPEVISYSIESVRCFAVTLPLLVLVNCFSNYLQGIGKVTQANIFGLLSGCGVLVPTVFVMTRFMGVRGAWFAYPVSQLIMLLVAIGMILRNQAEKFSDKMLMLPADFGTAAGEELEFVVENMNEVVGMAGIAGVFAEEHGADKKRAYILQLAVEEMGANIVKHGFADGKKHSINLRLLSKGDELIIRMRDDCTLFDPKKQYEMVKGSEDDLESGLGIRMIMETAKDFQYISTLKTNNLIIKV